MSLRHYSEADKSNGQAYMSAFREKNINAERDKGVKKDLDIKTGNYGNISLGYSEKNDDFVMTLSQSTNNKKTNPYSHNRFIEEGAAYRVRKKHGPQNALTSYKGNGASSAAVMRFNRNTSSEKTANTYKAILSGAEGKNTAAADALEYENTENQHIKVKLLSDILKAKKKTNISSEHEKLIRKNIDSIRKELSVKQYMAAKLQKAVRQSIDNMKKAEAQDGFTDILIKKKHMEEEYYGHKDDETLYGKKDNIIKHIT